MEPNMIEWLCEFATCGITPAPCGDWIRYKGKEIQVIEHIDIYEPAFIQSAIEGINGRLQKGIIFQNPFCIWCRFEVNNVQIEESFYFRINPEVVHELGYKSPLAAKKATLKYIMENAAI